MQTRDEVEGLHNCQSRDYSSSFIMNTVVIVITVVLLILFHHFLIAKLSIFAFPFFFLPFVLFFFVLFFNFSSGKWFMMTSCQIKTTESFIVRQPPIQRERTLSNNEVHLQKRETQSERTGSGNGELEILKWGTLKMGKF